MKSVIFFSSLCIVLVISSCKTNQGSNKSGENEIIARSFIESWNSHDVNKLVSLFSQDCLYEEVASGRSFSTPEQIYLYFTGTISGVPDSKFETVNLFANDSLAVVEWTWKGTNSVGWTDMGIPATNKYFELRGLSFMVIKNDSIKRNSDYWDWNSFMTGIGAK